MARLVGYGGNVFVGSLVVEDCEDIWNEFSDADVTPTADTLDYKVGSASAKFVQAAGLGNGDILGSEVIALGTLAAYTILFCWAKSSVNINTADDYRILIDNDALAATPEVQCSLPVLVANVWKFCQCPVVAGLFTNSTLPISIAIQLFANDPGAATLWLDHIVAAAQVAGIRAWSLDVAANVEDSTSYSDGQDKVFTVTQMEWSGSFDGFKDGAPLAIGTVVALELRESSTATQQWRGSAIITNLRPAVTVDGLVMYSYDFRGIHALEWPTT